MAGSEAVRRLVRAGLEVDLYEMKPSRYSPAHKLPGLAELVCSNSLRSDDPHSAVGLIKEEMRRMGSLVMEAAEATRVPAGKALAVDREKFSEYVTRELSNLPGVRIITEEVARLDTGELTVLATGPLTSEPLSRALAELVGTEHLYFYDAIAPIVGADSVDPAIAFRASRYDEESEGDYLNCPMNEEEYRRFYEALLAAEKTPLRDFEEPRFFEGCLPIEVMAERGEQTLLFGPMKPVGLTDPRTAQRPYAVVQLRRENAAGTLYNLVGFQTRLTWNEQDRIFRLIPALAGAEFLRYGSVHRNTFLNGPRHLNEFLQLKDYPNILVAGQVAGVEGYVESAAMGIIAGENAARLAMNRRPVSPPPTTAMGGLITHLTDTTSRNFQPMNINFGLLPPPNHRLRKKDRPAFYAQRALADLETWLREVADVS